MSFKVTSVIDGDTFQVSPHWKWKEQTGNIVRPIGYNAPENGEEGYATAKEKLVSLILGIEVELVNAVKLSYGRLLCEVQVNGHNLADFFPEYQ